MRILIAEDDIAVSESYKDALEARNHEVTLAKNGEECLKIYRTELKGKQTELEKRREHRYCLRCCYLGLHDATERRNASRRGNPRNESKTEDNICFCVCGTNSG